MDQEPQIVSVNTQSKWPIIPTWLIIVLLLITYPLGIILMWLFTKWSIKIKLAITFAPALIIIFLIVFVFFSLNSQRQDLKEKSTLKESQKIITTEATEKQDDIIWKLYKNNNLGLTMNYPKEWRFLEGGQRNEKGFQVEEVHFGLTGSSISVDARKLANSKGFDLNEYVDSVKPFDQIISKTVLNINGVTAIQLVGGQGGIKTYIMRPEDKKNVFLISIYENSNPRVKKETSENFNKYIETYQKMIRTFQFIDN